MASTDSSNYKCFEELKNQGINTTSLPKNRNAEPYFRLRRLLVVNNIAENDFLRTVSDVVHKDIYYILRKAKDDEANRLYTEMLETESDGLYIRDIMRGGIKNNDPRILRNICE